MKIDFFAPTERGLQHASLRAANRRAVLTTIAMQSGRSNAEVSRHTGLAPQTASAIVAELEAEGMVLRGEVLRGRRGQPATPLFLNAEGAYAIGCELGRRHLEIVLINLSGTVIARYRRDFDYPDASSAAEEIAGLAKQFVESIAAEHRHRLVGIGLATPTNIGRNIEELGAPPEQGVLWAGLDLRAGIEARTGLITQWYNDGNAACWAEVSFHPAPRPASFTYLFVTTFLGAGIIAQHRLWEGPTGNSANLGSMLVPGRDGKLEFGHRLASLSALQRRLAAAGIAVPTGNPLDWPWDSWEPVLGDWIAEAAGALSKIVVNAAAAFEFDTAVIDGVLPRPILARLVEETRRQLPMLPATTLDKPQVLPGHAGVSAPAIGAAMLPLYRRYFSREINHMLV